MSYTVNIRIREREYEIEVTRDYGYEEDTGAHDIDWNWIDEPPPNLTDHEDQLISDQIYEASEAHAHDGVNFDDRA